MYYSIAVVISFVVFLVSVIVIGLIGEFSPTTKTTKFYPLIPIDGKYILTNTISNTSTIKFTRNDSLIIAVCNSLEFCDTCTSFELREIKREPKPSKWILVPDTSYMYTVLVPTTTNNEKVLEK